ncbi:hypothetical protein CbuD7D7780_08730 [Coxiella burnetii]|nr:hypothetical protein CbuD7E6568_08715 [Coxiella burnetii]OYK81649.1 hypothetical protein CbuD7D7780_08730 [Coxiella burnetii]
MKKIKYQIMVATSLLYCSFNIFACGNYENDLFYSPLHKKIFAKCQYHCDSRQVDPHGATHGRAYVKCYNKINKQVYSSGIYHFTKCHHVRNFFKQERDKFEGMLNNAPPCIPPK